MAQTKAIKLNITVEARQPMIDIQAIVKIAVDAGEQILAVYQQDFAVTDKQDSSPLTEADMRAHHLICARLSQLTPDIPALSEESSAQDSLDRMQWTRYWLVDPLDGTKEFVKRNGEFTVNIALIDNGVPVMGVVHAPALGISYWGEQGRGAFKQEGQAAPVAIQAAQPPLSGKSWKVVGSRSHASADFESFMTSLPNAELVAMGSSLKLCLVAEGAADLYPRLGPTSEWDTAAAQAVVEAAGGQVLRYPELTPLRYNQNPQSLLNPWFVVCSQSHPDWTTSAVDKTKLVYEERDNDSKADVVWHKTQVTPIMRRQLLGQRPRCIWLTGLSGSGKSTIANALEFSLHKAGNKTFLLDGDNVRHGLNKDLGMTDQDREENIRRVGEVAKLMVDAGLLVITAFISPFREDREKARARFAPGEFVEVYIDAPIEECERRDPKGLYHKVRLGQLKDFTGIDSPYEAPESAEIVVPTQHQGVGESVAQIMAYLDSSSMQ